MARFFVTFFCSSLLLLATASPSVRKSRQAGPVTCPGFPGFCSESYPGDTCLVVCAFGRNNVPECQTNGRWTDTPRCIEHEPGVPEQVPGICPGIPGYCSLSESGGICEFDCITGKDIRSVCTPDGTWDPYPTCDGDIRETKDGCNPCPGPFGGPRNRQLEKSGQFNVNNNVPAPFQAPRQQARDPVQFQAPRQQARDPVQFQAPRQQARDPVPFKAPRQHTQQTFRAPKQQARTPFNNNVRKNNNDNRVTVIQPARETGFSPAPQPAFIANNREQVRRFQGNVPKTNNNFRSRNSFGSRTQNNRQQQKPSFRPPNVPTGRLNINNNNINRNNGIKTVSSARCPGNSLEVCIDVCPSFSARIFGACVAGCARRCPNKK